MKTPCMPVAVPPHTSSPRPFQEGRGGPDWVCEILSQSGENKDREIRMPIDARYGVASAWLIEPLKHTLEAYALTDGDWQEIG